MVLPCLQLKASATIQILCGRSRCLQENCADWALLRPRARASSPDGRILFGREGDLYLAEKDGSNPRKLVSVKGLIRQPSISPDGQRVAFTVWSRIPVSPEAIFESMADGSSLLTR